MARIYQDFIGGKTDAALTAVSTTLSSPALAAMQAVASPDTMMIALNPDQVGTAAEIVTVTAHTAAATTATITRGSDGTTAIAHVSGIDWIHGLMEDDVAVLSYVTRGSGSPESVVTAPVGSLFLRTDGGASTTLYIKESGTGNTGWVAK